MEFVIVILVLLAVVGLVLVNRSKASVTPTPGTDGGGSIDNPIDNNVHEK